MLVKGSLTWGPQRTRELLNLSMAFLWLVSGQTARIQIIVPFIILVKSKIYKTTIDLRSTQDS